MSYNYDREIETLPEDIPGNPRFAQDSSEADIIDYYDNKAHALKCEESY